MRTGVRLTLCLVAACGLLAGVLWLLSGWAASGGLDCRSLAELGEQIRRDTDREKELTREAEALNRLALARAEVIDDLVADRVSLSEAVEGFRRLSEGQPRGPGIGGELPPDHHSTAAVAGWILEWVEWDLRGAPPQRREEVLARLNAESAALTPSR
jgi:hypothetical protein